MDYTKIEKYEYKAPSYELKNRAEANVDYFAHTKKRRFFFDARDGIFKSSAGNKNSISMLFAGDLLCQENILQRHASNDGGYDFSLCFEYMKPLFSSSDFVAGNLETPVSHTAPYRGEILSHEGPFFCNAPVQYLEALSDAGFDMLTTENNHTLDAGVRGLFETIENSDRFGFIQTGTFAGETEKFVVVDICGFKVGFTAFGCGSYNTMQQNLTAEGRDVLLNTYSFERAQQIYAAMKKKGAEYVVCFPHWGKEYTDVLSEKQTDIAKELTSIGYDLLAGAHSHVAQKFAFVNSKPVLYSMGSFISHLNSLGKHGIEYTVLCHLTLTRNGSKITPSVGFIPCKVMRGYKGIPFSVIPVCAQLGLSEADEDKLAGTTQWLNRRLVCKTARMHTSFPINEQALADFSAAQATLPERVDKLVAVQKEEATAAPVVMPSKHFWEPVTDYHILNNCLYKIALGRGELLEMGNPASVVVLPTAVEKNHIKTVSGNGKANNTTRLLYLGKQVETVNEGAFCNYTKLESVRFYSNVKTIGARAFAGCINMTGIVLPRSLKKIEKEAFAGCTSLLTVKIPANVTSIASDAFAQCPKLTVYCEQDSAADRFAKAQGFPVRYMPMDSGVAAESSNSPAAAETAPAAENKTAAAFSDTVMGPMNGPQDKHPASIIATCKFLGHPLPEDAVCGNQPSFYLGRTTMNGKMSTLRNLLGDRMLLQDDLERQEKFVRIFRNKFKSQDNLPFSPTDMAVYFSDWVLFARDRGFSISDYFEYELYRKEPEVRDTFLNEGYRQRVYEVCNTPNFRGVFLDKGKFNTKFKKYVNRDWVDASTCTFEEFKAFAEKHEEFFCKPIRGTGGKGARVIQRNSDTLENIFAEAKEEGLIMEEVIRQHAEMAEFNASTLNTIRICTMLCADGVARVMLAVGRFGRAGNAVDNFHSGGVTAVIDVETGVIFTEAIDITQWHTPVHPDSKKPILGFKYPHWEKIKAAVCDAAMLSPKVKHVGWDVALTVDGNVEFVEGNSRPNFDVLQVPDQMGRRHYYDKYFPAVCEAAGEKFAFPEPLNLDIGEPKPAAVAEAPVAEEKKVEIVIPSDTVMGPMNGPKDKHPASIIATCHFLGHPLPEDAVCGNQPSHYLGRNKLNGKMSTLRSLLGDRMPLQDDLEKQEKTVRLFRNKFKSQDNLPFSPTDMAVYFSDWVLYARDRGFSISDYFEYELYRKEPEVRDTFLNEGYRQRVYEVCNTPGFRGVFLDKGKFNTRFSKYVKRDWVDASTCTFEEFKEFAEKHEEFFCKPIRGTGGKGARVIQRNSDTLENIFAEAKEEGLIMEEVIRQHPEMAEFNASTLNTIRVCTMLCADGEARVMLAVGRFGRAGNAVDNFHSGGVTAVIDVETGVIFTEAIDITQWHTPVHPDSKKPILGFRYPHWEKIKAAVCDAAKLSPKVKHVGWDVALTVDGNVEFVEGNSRPNFDVLQVPDQMGRRHYYDKYFPDVCAAAGEEFVKPEPLHIDITGMESKKKKLFGFGK